MTALDRMRCMAVAVMEFIVNQVRCEVDASWHAPVLQQHAAPAYHTLSRIAIFFMLE